MRRHIGLILSAVLVLLSLVACQTQPTKIVENTEANLVSREDLSKPLVFTKETIVLDTRSSYEYSSYHFPGSRSVRWGDFTLQNEEIKGRLDPDSFAIARRLALLGVSPESKVIVVGNGIKGEGEEGRVAWMLKYLGIRDVSFAAFNYFKGPVSNVESPPPKNAPVWKPQTVDSLLVTKEELLHVLNRGGVYKSTTFKDTTRRELYRIIDVRSPREYLGKEGLGLTHKVPNMEAINIHWKEFFQANGRAKADMADQLRAVGVLPEHRVIVISEEGVKSAAVTMALINLGYSKAGNYAGGLQELLFNP